MRTIQLLALLIAMSFFALSLSAGDARPIFGNSTFPTQGKTILKPVANDGPFWPPDPYDDSDGPYDPGQGISGM